MKIKFEYKITLLYLLIGILWIVFSDKLLEYLAYSSAMLSTFQSFKGIFYVLVTGLLLFLFVKQHLKILRKSEEQLIHHNEKLEALQADLKKSNEEYYSLYEEYKAQNESLLEAKELAEKSKAHFELLFDNAPDAIFIQVDHKFAYLNKQAVKLFGINNAQELIGASVLDSFHPDDHDAIVNRIQNLNNKKISQPFEKKTAFRADRSPVEVEVSGVPIRYENKDGAMVFARDITHQQQYLKEIKEKKSFIETVLDNLPIGLAMNSFDGGEATYMNERFVEIYGWPREELKDISTFFECVYPDAEYREEIMRKINQDIASGDPTNMHWENIVVTQKNGSQRIVNAVNIPLPEQNTMVSTVMDVTDLKRTQDQLLAAKEKAEESNRLKTAFINNISHEFRTPLNGILGFVELLVMPTFKVEKREKYARIIKESSSQLLDVVTDTIEVSHIQSKTLSVNHSTFCLNEVVKEVVKAFKLRVEQKGLLLNVMSENGRGSLEVKSDRHKMQRILKHLLDNALKFTDAGRISVQYACKNNMIYFTVQDTGIGIDENARSYIFESFRQTETGYTRNFGGNGIGLFIVKAYVEKLNGDIEFQSEPGKGTEFMVKIPVETV